MVMGAGGDAEAMELKAPKTGQPDKGSRALGPDWGLPVKD